MLSTPGFDQGEEEGFVTGLASKVLSEFRRAGTVSRGPVMEGYAGKLIRSSPTVWAW